MRIYSLSFACLGSAIQLLGQSGETARVAWLISIPGDTIHLRVCDRCWTEWDVRVRLRIVSHVLFGRRDVELHRAAQRQEMTDLPGGKMGQENCEQSVGLAFSHELIDERSHVGWGRPKIRQQDDRRLGKLRSCLLRDFGRSLDGVQAVIEQNQIDSRIGKRIGAREPDQ